MTGLDAEAFSERAAYYLSEINALHPFREGNGRAQREFINLLAYKNGFSILRQEVVRLTAEGMTKKRIAQQINIGEASVYRILAASQKQ